MTSAYTFASRALDHPPRGFAHGFVVLGFVACRISKMIQATLDEVEKARLARLDVFDQPEQHMFDGDFAAAPERLYRSS